MSEIIEKTYKLLDALDNSHLIKDLTISKEKLQKNNHLLSLINKYQKESQPEQKINLKKEIYLDKDYQTYIKCYNELSYLVIKINNQYHKYTNTKENTNKGEL